MPCHRTFADALLGDVNDGLNQESRGNEKGKEHISVQAPAGIIMTHLPACLTHCCCLLEVPI